MMMILEGIQTADLRFKRQPLYQLCHNHCPWTQFLMRQQLEVGIHDYFLGKQELRLLLFIFFSFSRLLLLNELIQR